MPLSVLDLKMFELFCSLMSVVKGFVREESSVNVPVAIFFSTKDVGLISLKLPWPKR